MTAIFLITGGVLFLLTVACISFVELTRNDETERVFTVISGALAALTVAAVLVGGISAMIDASEENCPVVTTGKNHQ